MIARVVLYSGRYHLRVAGLYVAAQGDPCCSPLTSDKFWTLATLMEAAEEINRRITTIWGVVPQHDFTE